MGIGSSITTDRIYGPGCFYTRTSGDGSSISNSLCTIETQGGTSVDRKFNEGNITDEYSYDFSVCNLPDSPEEQKLPCSGIPIGYKVSKENCKNDSVEKTEDKVLLASTRIENVILQSDGSTVDDVFIQTHKREDIQKWKIDKDAWKDCIEEILDETKAKTLIEDNILPDEQVLLKIIKSNTQQTNVVQRLIRKICNYIKVLSPKIRHVWLAYRSERSDEENKGIVFVIHTSETIEIECKYTTYQRCEDDISPTSISENKDIYKAEKNYNSEIEEMRAFVKTNAKTLMLKHSNLTRVSASCVKSSKADSIQNIPCIALYVQIKGLVPFGEETFEKTITKFPIDVREGVFTLCGKPDDLHQNVKMGCQIDSGFGTSQGTIGPFVQLENHKETYFLTSAHVALNNEQMGVLTKSPSECIYYGISGNKTFQPPESKTVMSENKRYRLGKIELAVYNEGDENETGVELALVQIDKNREPVDGSFPEDTSSQAGTCSSKYSQFSTGKILERKNIESKSVVYKFGCTTGLTEGQYVDDCTSVRTNKLEERGLGVDITLFNLIQITNSQPSKPFAEPGDSGSLVFAIDGDETCAVGIFEGQMKPYYMVTPIEEAVRVIGRTLSLYKGRSNDSGEDMETESYCDLKVIQLPFKTDANSRNQAIDDLEKRTSNIETNIIHHSEHNFGTVKTELTAMKAHFDQSNAEMKRYLDGRFDAVMSEIAKFNDRK